MAPNENAPVSSTSQKRIFPQTDDDEIVISGMSGKFPNSANTAIFEYNLYNKIDMVDDSELRWRHFNPEIPRRGGRIGDLGKFDATFFGVHFKQAHTMDPQCRMLLETSYEAILDAGINPRTLKGTRTGVFIGACTSESEKTWFYEKVSAGGFGITGCSRAMMANRISYSLGLNGPSFVLDTACSSSMYALDSAYSAFRNDEVDAAIVGAVNLTLHPFVTLQFARLGVLASDGYCRPFDANASGYTRSESINCIFLQRRRFANRCFGTLVHSKTNCDGFKTEGITFPSGIIQERLLREFYGEIGLNPEKLGYMEAHSTGTIVGDPEECRAIDAILCSGRSKPLLIGSVKSNIGHAEAASGICSIVKAVYALEKRKIAPNLHFKSIREDIPALLEGRLKVVDEIEDLKSPYIGINSFGFGGANAHALLRGCEKEKRNNGAPTDDLPRLVQWSGRTEEGINIMLDGIESNPLDTEYLALAYNIQKEGTPGFVFRGYGLYSHREGDNALCIAREVQHYTGVKRPVVWVFSGMGSQWSEMGSSLMSLPLFRDSIYRCHNALKPKGLDLINIITSPDPTTFDNILNSFVGIAAIQIAIVDILRELDFEPDYLIGHSVGELGCAYADGGFTAEQMILSAYSRGKVSVDAVKIKGSMAAIGLGYRDIVKLLPPAIEVACRNSADSSTISGPKEEVEKFVAELKSKNIFAKEVPCSNIAYHSRYIAQMGPFLLKYLREIIPNPKKRSAKWLSSSIPKNQWNQPEAELCSAEYHTNNLLNSVLFEDTAALLPANALTVEIAPHGLLQAILKKSMRNAVNIGLTQRGNKNNFNFFLQALGKIYLNGFNLPIHRLYPKVEFPVSRGTRQIAPYVRWDHSDTWFSSKFENIRQAKTGERIFPIGLKHEDSEFIGGHIIDGKILIPATFYLQLVWETYSQMYSGPMYMNMPVEFSDIRFVRATHINKDSNVNLTVSIQHGTGEFDISESGATVVTGRIEEIINPEPAEPPSPPTSDNFALLETRDFYKELRLRGYHYAGAFRSVMVARSDGLGGRVKWNMNWASFMDCLLQIHIVGADSRSLMLPTRIRKLRILGLHHIKLAADMETEDKYFDVQVDPITRRLIAGGIEIEGLHASPVSRRKQAGVPVLEAYKFIPHLPAPRTDMANAIRICVQTLLENDPVLKMKIVEVDQDKTKPVITHFQDALDDLPVITGDLMLLSEQALDLAGIHVENGKLSTQSNCSCVVSTNLLERPEWVAQAEKSITENGYLVSVETNSQTYGQIRAPTGFNIVAFLPVDSSVVVLLRRCPAKVMATTVIKVSEKDTEYSWLLEVKAAPPTSAVILVAQNECFNGLIGLVNCLRKEPGSNNVTCVFIDDPQAPPFAVDHPFYAERLKFGLAINVFRNGQWGTYRHLPFNSADRPERANKAIYVDALQKGDLSSLTWFQGPVSVDEAFLKIVYSAMNFRDVMLATGRITMDTYDSTRLDNQCVLGFEFSGIDRNGNRLMGLKINKGLATHIDNVSCLFWDVPDYWTLAEAATIPCVYTTVYMAFFHVADIRKGKSILIHAGTGGVGQAAIAVALAYGLEVFTTVGTQEKKRHLMERFPKLEESHIGNSRNTSFEDMVMKQTKGKGVDFVLNSLAEDKLRASLRCLGSKGHFFEIGKFDIASDNKIGLSVFEREISLHSIFADRLIFSSTESRKVIQDLVTEGIEQGIIKPIPSTVFKCNEVEKAFRYMAAGKHMGKVLIQIHEENDTEQKTIEPVTVVPQVFFDPNLVYIIPGGLGGFGLELADWMILREARKIVLSSSRGITKSYQQHRINVWKSYGAQIEVRTDDITTHEGCFSLISAASKLGYVGGIFNLAVILRDAIFTNQTPAMFQECMSPKALATAHLDKLSRKMCPHLKYFVVFSSVSCGRGNAGQTNYGMANSVMERIIERRARDGLPAKAVQWGAVGEVGLVADMAEDKIDMEIGGTLQQRISSCLQELDNLLTYNYPIVSSMVVAEKRRNSSNNIMATVMNIMGIRDLKSISMGSSLSETGMDSLMAVEIKQTLERDFELNLTPQDLRSMTFEKLQEISDAKNKDDGEHIKLRLARDDAPTGMALLLRNLGDELNSHHTILPLVTKNSNLFDLSPTLIVPGLEGVAGPSWYNLALGLYSPSNIVQLMDTIDMSSISEMANFVIEKVAPLYKRNQHFYLIGYSFGTLLTLELAHMLEKLGHHGQVTIIDGSPLFLKKLASRNFKESYTDEELQILLFTSIVVHFFPEELLEEVAVKFSALPGWDGKLAKLMEYADKQTLYSKEYAEKLTRAFYNRVKLVNATPLDTYKHIEAPITLIRPTDVSVLDIDEDYELSKYTSGKVTVKFIEGDHSTMLDNPILSQIINSYDTNMEEDKCFEGIVGC